MDTNSLKLPKDTRAWIKGKASLELAKACTEVMSFYRKVSREVKSRQLAARNNFKVGMKVELQGHVMPAYLRGARGKVSYMYPYSSWIRVDVLLDDERRLTNGKRYLRAHPSITVLPLDLKDSFTVTMTNRVESD